MQTEKNMAGPYEIIVLDLDGTLTNRDKVVTPRTKAALMKAQERGKKVVLASGRPTQGVMPLAKELRLDEYSGYILSFNGGRIINCKTGETVFARSLPVSANKKIIGLAEEHQVDIATYEGSRIISSNPESPYGRLESRINGMELWKPEDMKEYVNFEVPKFLMMEDGDYLAMVEPKVKAAMGKNFSVYRSDPFFLEILPKGIDKAQSLVIRYKDNMRMLIFLSCVAGAFLGAITSATATAAIMIPLLVGIANDIGVSRSKLLYPSMACANIATQMTFLGQGASNMAWNDVMMQAGAPTPLHIWDFTIARIPMLTIAILYMTFVGYKLMPDIPNEQFSDAAHTASESEKLSPFKRKLAVLIVLVSIAMMLLENVIGVKMYLTSCIGAAALVLTGVLTEREALNSIHQPTIFLFAGVLALSDAIQTTGAGDVVADWMIRLLGDTTNPYIIMLVFFLVPFILTQVMSNLATLTIFIPLVTSACIRMGVDPRAAVVGVITASCVSIMTPMAAPCQIMIIEPGGYTLKDYLKCGTPLALILIVVSVFFLPTLYPFA